MSQTSVINKVPFDLEPLGIIRTIMGLRNGIYYGCRVRFMHSIVMSLLFKSGSVYDKIVNVVQPTYEHGKNLGMYVFLYKAIVNFLEFVRRGKKDKIHSLVAGAIIGRYVFGEKTPVNHQIVLYLLSRNITGGVTNLQARGIFPKMKFFPILAAICWGLVMFIYEVDKLSLQKSLSDSMDFLYKESDLNLKHWTELVPFKIPSFILENLNNIFNTPLPNLTS
ncbi:hypothetical protein ABPG72_009545 [Tetrahymena utriculariae]